MTHVPTHIKKNIYYYLLRTKVSLVVPLCLKLCWVASCTLFSSVSPMRALWVMWFFCGVHSPSFPLQDPIHPPVLPRLLICSLEMSQMAPHLRQTWLFRSFLAPMFLLIHLNKWVKGKPSGVFTWVYLS